MTGRTRRELEIERGSGNVYRDLGVPDAQSRQLRVELAVEIMRIIRKRGLSQRQAAEVIGLSQPDVSRLNKADLGRFTIDRLVDVLGRLGRRVEMRVARTRGRAKAENA